MDCVYWLKIKEHPALCVCLSYMGMIKRLLNELNINHINAYFCTIMN